MTLIGQRLGHYSIVQLLGQEGMGEVYLAEDTLMPHQVTIKIMRNGLQLYSDTEAQLFQRAMQAIAQSGHAYILGFSDFGEESTGAGFIVYIVWPDRLPPDKLHALFSFAIDAVIQRAVVPKTDERFPTREAFAHALLQALTYTDLHALLEITELEALQGSSVIILLADKCPVTVTIPPSAVHGQVLSLPDQGTSYYDGGPRGPLFLTLSIVSDETILPIITRADENDVPTVLAGNAVDNQLSPMIAASHESDNQLPPDAVANSQADNQLSASADVNAPLFPMSELASLQPEPVLGVEQKSIQPVHAIANRSKPSTKRIILIVAAVLLLIAASVLPINAVRNVVATNNAHASATARTAAEATATVRAAQNAMTAYYAEATVDAQATALVGTANPDPYQPPAGTFAFVDPLIQPYKWHAGSKIGMGGKCLFVNSTYQVSEITSRRWFSCNSHEIYSDFAFEVKMTINQGNCGGLTLQGSYDYKKLYFFEVCQNGYYNFWEYTSNSLSQSLTNGVDNASAIKQGTGQTNIIAVVANRGEFNLFVNNQHIDSINNSDYSEGYLGLVAEDFTGPTNVTYQNAKMWSI